MTHVVTSEKYQSDDVVVEETQIELIDGEFSFTRQLEDFDADTLVVIHRISGHVEIKADIPSSETQESELGQVFKGETSGAVPLYFSFASRGVAKLKVIISQVRRGFSSAFRGLPCKLCKLALKTIASTILVQLGVPVLPTGEFDLKNAINSVLNVAADIANGVYGQVVEALSSLLPTNWWNVVLNVLHAANWLWNVTDAFFEKICRLLGMCPPAQPAAQP